MRHKQPRLTERLCDHHEVVGIEVLVQQVEAGAIGQYQLAELLQLVLGREGVQFVPRGRFSRSL
nr:hypothetical protein [Aeromonas media]